MLGSRGLGILLSVSTGLFGWAAQAREIRIEDSDTTFFQLSGAWQSYTKDKFCDQNLGCAGRLDQTKTSGQSYSHGDAAFGVTGSCKFRGSAIAIYGVDLPQQGLIRFRLDDSSPVAYENQPGQLVYNSVMFRASGLATDIEHTLRWTIEVSRVSGGSIVLDYAVITVPDPTNTPIAPVPGTTSQRTITTSTTALPNTGPTVPSDSNTSTKPSQAESVDTRRGPSTMRETISNAGNTIIAPTESTSPLNVGTQTAPDVTNPTSTETTVNKGSNTGAIVGGVVGGLLGAVALGALLFLFIRRRRRYQRRSSASDFQSFASPNTWTAPPSFVNFSPVSTQPRHSVQASSDLGTESSASNMEARLRYLEQRIEEGDVPPPLYDRRD